ncbi:unnamed protein product [Tetraodon nigroviridis]|uniref:(spotted green pufferfish) hypothetical protein n=1 Tax=Tetraodon nigroviridis TaxID=99883 RepID=Q4RIU3_TETNG|nr:unnamed protein product [Tetraodon nigroviridis]
MGSAPSLFAPQSPRRPTPAAIRPPTVPHGPNPNDHNSGNRRGMMSDEAKATILHLRESLVRQKETILDQRETIRELTAKLTLCEGFGGHHSSAQQPPRTTVLPPRAVHTPQQRPSLLPRRPQAGAPPQEGPGPRKARLLLSRADGQNSADAEGEAGKPAGGSRFAAPAVWGVMCHQG